MIRAIGFLEFSSIARGIEAGDAVLKAADVSLVSARPTCPGKYALLFTGEVAAVSAALEAGTKTGEAFLVDSVLIPNVDPQVVRAIGMSAMPERPGALGVMEFFSIAAAVYSADAAVKAADVELLDVRLGTGIGGKSYVLLTGEVAAVAEAVRCGIAAEEGKGLLVSSTVIPNPDAELFESLL